MRQKLNHITLGVCDLEGSVNFFEKGLGCKKSDASVEALALFPIRGIVLTIHPRKELAEDANVSPEGSGVSGITLSYNAKSEKEVDEVLTKVASLGAKIIKPSQRVYCDGYSGYFRDLDGHLFELAHSTIWELDHLDHLILT